MLASYMALAEEARMVTQVPSLLTDFYCVPTASRLAVPISQVVSQTLTKAWGPPGLQLEAETPFCKLWSQ